jgi:hypothetical protein
VYFWRPEMHYLPKAGSSRSVVGFVSTRCPKCHRITSYLSFQTSPLLSCTWTDCGHAWVEPETQPRADQTARASDEPGPDGPTGPQPR